MPVWVGTSGWQYRHWRASVYPGGLAQGRWLEWYAERFATVEVNATFYRLPRPQVAAGWHARTPAGFLAAVKASRYLTHVRRLRDPAEPVERFLRVVVEPLQAALGPVLLQLPPNLPADASLLDEALAAWPPRLRLAVEPRHDTWWCDDVAAVLAGHGAALCLADRGGRPRTPLWRTAGWGYVRFHEGRAQPRPCYGAASLASWAERIAARWGPDDDVFVYFNNDPLGCAVRDAGLFARAAQQVGLRPTRTPPPSAVALGATPPPRTPRSRGSPPRDRGS